MDTKLTKYDCDFKSWIYTFKLVFSVRHKVDVNANWDDNGIKEYYDSGLSVDGAIDKFFQEMRDLKQSENENHSV
jgi:hypothetical protein